MDIPVLALFMREIIAVSILLARQRIQLYLWIGNNILDFDDVKYLKSLVILFSTDN